MFNFCPLQGALSESTASQSLLELDGGVKVLIDVGWDESFDVAKLREVEKQTPTLSLILLTHATVSHLAAYAYCCKNIPLFTRIPVYATLPVIDLGRTVHHDLYASTPAAATTVDQDSLAEASYAYTPASSDANFLRQAPTSEEIARYFSLTQPIKYSQPLQPLPSPFSPPLNGLTITAYNSGHSLGGTIWHIQHGQESIVYAVDWNQGRENVFSGAAWLGGEHGGTDVIDQLRRPTALICSSRTPTSLSLARRDAQLVDHIKACVSKGGTVLIPVDSSARVLELSYLLERQWQQDAARTKDGGAVLSNARLFLAGRSVSSTFKNARSMLEWMDNRIAQEFETQADSSRKTNGDGIHAAPPFDFRHLRMLEKKGQIEKLVGQITQDEPRIGRVILATDRSLGWGFSRDILQSIAADPKNLVILTEKPTLTTSQPSIARTLWQWWEARQDGVATEPSSHADEVLHQIYGGGKILETTHLRQETLEGAELSRYQQWLATQRQLQATLQVSGATAIEEAGDAPDDASSSSSESEASETEQQGKALNISTTMGQVSRKKVVLSDEDLGINILLKKRGAYDYDVRQKKGRDRMFPILVRRKRDDEFGEIIRPEDFLRAEELGEDDNDRSGDRRNRNDDMGRKRKFDDVTVDRAGKNTAKRQQTDHQADDDGDLALSTTIPEVQDEFDAIPEDKQEQVVGPSKLITTKSTLQVNLRIAFVDYSGIHDRRTLNMIIPLIQPRKLILTSGSEEETMAVASDCRKLIGLADGGLVEVYTPAVGMTVDGSVDTNAWMVRLADPLVKRLKWQTVRGLGVVTITAQLLAEAMALASETQADTVIKDSGQEDSTNKRVKLDADAIPEIVPTLDVLPTSMTSASRAVAQPLHVGELRLADLRKASQQAGHTAEFRGEGTLLIDGSVVVRKSATGQVELESIGLPSAGSGMQAYQQERGAFHAVRNMIYQGLAVVAGA